MNQCKHEMFRCFCFCVLLLPSRDIHRGKCLFLPRSDFVHLIRIRLKLVAIFQDQIAYYQCYLYFFHSYLEVLHLKRGFIFEFCLISFKICNTYTKKISTIISKIDIPMHEIVLSQVKVSWQYVTSCGCGIWFFSHSYVRTVNLVTFVPGCFSSPSTLYDPYSG